MLTLLDSLYIDLCAEHIMRINIMTFARPGATQAQ